MEWNVQQPRRDLESTVPGSAMFQVRYVHMNTRRVVQMDPGNDPPESHVASCPARAASSLSSLVRHQSDPITGPKVMTNDPPDDSWRSPVTDRTQEVSTENGTPSPGTRPGLPAT
eukprot:642104-Hanusia_phi.AAC.1